MAIIVSTSRPKALLNKIKSAIRNGEIDTWTYDSEGDFTHTPNQWVEKAWFRPSTQSGFLLFGMLGQRNISMTKAVYGVYHGRFIEMLLTHFDNDFAHAGSTASGEEPFDNFK